MTTTPPFAAFELERWQSDWEQRVDVNLADSGVDPVPLGELLDGDLGPLAGHPLNYPEVNGTRRLRERIAALYPGCRPEQVLVTVGAAEANSLVGQLLVGAGDRVAVMTPGYQQVRGLAANAGAHVVDLPLRQERGWRPDLDALDGAVPPGTALVSVNTPNNPTGTVLTDAELDAVVAAAERSGAWLHSDEVYRGSELDGPEAPSAWGRCDRVLVVGSLSKAYGLSGLRVGWVVGPEDAIEALWRRHEYAAIATAGLSMLLAERALEPATRSRLLDRQRTLARAGRRTLLDWVAAHPDLVALDPPAATALGLPRLLRQTDSVAVATAVRERAGVLVCPGVYLGAEGHVRLSHALDPGRTARALDRIAEVLRAR
jgi:aspartate/methionine/tyrosine aminotransferase